MLRIREAIVVEGRYDRHALAALVDTVIVETGGFRIFKDKQKRAFLRRLAAARGLILLTDSDGAGFVIRNHLKSCIPPAQLKQAYIPPLPGKERRKANPSGAGLLGVEAMSPQILAEALRRAGATFLDEETDATAPAPISRADLYRLGLFGGTGSAKLRRALLDSLALPRDLGVTALLPVLGTFYDLPGLEAALSALDFSEKPAEAPPGNAGKPL